ncbi:MAG TPA: DUF5339 family protein [Pseudoxanthomonas sp.]|nr:DUF5339 family protein [Pseudoxanthomonas sp.]
MKKLLIALALCTALSACNKADPAAPATTGAETPPAAVAASEPAAPAPAAPGGDTAPAADPAAATGDAASAPGATGDATASKLPAVCEAYIKRAEACFAKAGSGADALRSEFEKGRAQMATMPAAEMEAGCALSDYAFAQVAATLKCE